MSNDKTSAFMKLRRSLRLLVDAFIPPTEPMPVTPLEDMIMQSGDIVIDKLYIHSPITHGGLVEDILDMIEQEKTFYLHWWKEKEKRFTTEEEERANDFQGIVRSDDQMAVNYPGGFKYWKRRKLSDAPAWALEEQLCKS